MNTKWTPGPWHVGKPQEREAWCVKASNGIRVAWIDFWGQQIETGNLKSDDEQRANARLIAAAPELAEVLADCEAEFKMVLRDFAPLKATFVAPDWQPYKAFLTRVAFVEDTMKKARSLLAKLDLAPTETHGKKG